ncbi:MAG TPA: protein kinase [Planctomycetota bacterium]|nr:protein kinase [Planctomycetota bacterium]
MSSHESEEKKEPPRAFPQFSRYEVREVLGEGATSVVYAAWDRELHRPVAIKLLRESAGLSDLARQRFRREAQAAAGMAHPNVVTLYDAGEQDGRPYLVLELVEGRSFSETLQKNPGFRREHVALLAKAARGVGAVHAKGIVHRDLKPGNILVTPSGEPKIGDFGLVHLEGTTMELTRAGATLGTPYYMAPEQVESRPGQISPRTDVYGLGAILYEILSGRAPHVGESLVEIYKQILQDDPVRIRAISPQVPPDLEAIALKALSKDPAARYDNGDDFADDLGRFLAGQPVKAKPPSFADEVRKTWVRNRPVFLAAGIGLAVALVVAALVIPRWMEEKKARELAERKGKESNDRVWDAREKDLRELLSLWSDVQIAKQGWYQAQKDPRDTRGKIEEAVRALSAFIERHPEQPQGYYVRARASLHLDDLERAEADLQKVTALEPGFGPAWALLGRVYLEHMWDASLRNKMLQEDNIDEPKVFLQRATEAFAKVPASASGKGGLDRIDEETTAAPVARTLLIAFSEKDMAKAKASLLEIHRQSPSEEFALLLGQLAGEIHDQIQWASEAIRIRPHFFKAYFNRGTSKEVMDDLVGAEADYDAALKINPHHAITYLNRAYVRERRGNSAGSLEDSAEAIRRKPGYPGAHQHRAVSLMHLKDFKGAMDEVNEALRLQPDLFTALALRAYIRTEMGDQAGALQDATRAHDLGPRYAYALSVRGLVRFRQGDLAGALADSNEALRLNPKDAATYVQRGGLRMLQDDPKPALADFAEAIRIDPKMARAYNGRAALRLVMGENQAGYEDALRAIALDPKLADAYANRALAEIRLSRFEAAVASATQGVKADSKSSLSYGYRGLARAMLGEFSDALDDLNVALERAPGNANFRVNRAELRTRLGDAPGAVEDATEAIRLIPHFGDAWRNRASARLTLQDFKGGLEDATEAIKLNPTDWMSYSNRAGARVQLKDYAGAIEDATKALQLNRSIPQSYAFRAIASLRLDKTGPALDDCAAGLKIAPNNPDLLYCRALAAEKQAGRNADPAALRKDLEAALDLGGARWLYRDDAEAALQRLRDKK